MHATHGPDAGTPVVHDAGGEPHDTVVHDPHGMVNEVQQSDGGTPTTRGFGIEPTRGPRSTARIRVLVTPTADSVGDHGALAGAAVSAGGKAVDTGNNGFALIDEVYGKDSADVLVRAMGFTEGRARVPIRDGEISCVVIMLAPTLSVKIENLAEGGAVEGTEDIPDSSVDAGFVTKPAVTLDLPADALVTPWDTPASGGGALQYVLLDEPAQAEVAPAGTTALAQDGSFVQLQLRALFDARITQGGTIFALTKPAGVEVPVAPDSRVVPIGGTPDAAANSDADRLYWFDPSKAAFVERTAITERGDMAHGSIDRFGLWAIGRPAAGRGCVHGRVQDAAGAALPYAALRTVQVAGLDSQLIWTDAGGNYCVEAEMGSTLKVFGLATSLTSGLMRIDTMIGPTSYPADASAPLCGDASTCAEGGAIAATPYALRCVQGMIEPTEWGVSWSATPSTGEGVGAGGSIEAGKPFCIEVPADSTLQITSLGDCGDTQTIAAGPTALCGEGSDCIDLGTLKCCDAQETCGDSADNDCDDMVDEGCTCGATTCSPVNDICCTPEATCGLHAPQTRKCLARDSAGSFNGACPDEVLDSGPLTGCCRTDMRCGVSDGQFGFGCVAREDAMDVFALAASLAPMTCTQ